MKNTDLLPCPFCGGRAELSSGKYDGKEISYVRCVKCLSQGEFFFVSAKYASAEKAIKAWNRRAKDEQIENAPTIERKQGKWLDNYQYGYKCSECGAYLEIDCGDTEMNFCPNCGADMTEKYFNE